MYGSVLYVHPMYIVLYSTYFHASAMVEIVLRPVAQLEFKSRECYNCNNYESVT